MVGTYTITAEAKGFKKALTPNVRVEVGQRVQQDLTLEIGAVTEASAGVGRSACVTDGRLANRQRGGE